MLMAKKRKLITGGIVTVLVIVAILLLLHFTGDKLEAMTSKDLIIQSNLEMTEVNIISQTSGQLIEVNVEEGDTIQEGDVIARVDSDTLLTQKAQAQAGIEAIKGQLHSAQAAYEKAKNGTRPEEEAQAKANFDLAEANYNRMKALYDSGALSKAEMDGVATNYEVAKQKYQLAQNGAQQEDIEAAAAAVETMQGQLAKAEASLAEINTYLEKVEIKSPASGVVTQLNIDNGGLISAGMTLAVVTDTSDSWIQCNVMEDELGNVQLGQNVKIEFGSYPDKIFKGEVIAVNKSADFAVKRATNANGEFDILSYGVKVKPLDVENEKLFAGMTAFVNFGPDKNKENK